MELSPLLLWPDGLGSGLGVSLAPGIPKQLQRRQQGTGQASAGQAAGSRPAPPAPPLLSEPPAPGPVPLCRHCWLRPLRPTLLTQEPRGRAGSELLPQHLPCPSPHFHFSGVSQTCSTFSIGRAPPSMTGSPATPGQGVRRGLGSPQGPGLGSHVPMPSPRWASELGDMQDALPFHPRIPVLSFLPPEDV